jgi:hypothetical protein
MCIKRLLAQISHGEMALRREQKLGMTVGITDNFILWRSNCEHGLEKVKTCCKIVP